MQELLGRFTAGATSSDWIAVMNAANRSEAPGAACLRVMLSAMLAIQEDVHGATRAF